MNMFFRRSINEYERQISLKESFDIQTERMQEMLESIVWASFDETIAERVGEPSQRLELLLLFPLIEVAWADGRISRRESDAILQVAGAYGLTRNEADYCELLDRLTTRPLPRAVERLWQDFRRLFENLPEFERENIAFCLDVQTRFVAEQSSDNLVSFLRGERISASEQEALLIIKQQLENALGSAKAIEEKRNAAVRRAEAQSTETREIPAPAADFFGEFERQTATLEDYAVLV
ncbi:MAG TPA: hypothetical protein VK308_12355, partial [Pyrinomonadaceae bacterium]|nr:hypothetical protein [Pyrinomonadaceae bacterium]